MKLCDARRRRRGRRPRGAAPAAQGGVRQQDSRSRRGRVLGPGGAGRARSRGPATISAPSGASAGEAAQAACKLGSRSRRRGWAMQVDRGAPVARSRRRGEELPAVHGGEGDVPQLADAVVAPHHDLQQGLARGGARRTPEEDGSGAGSRRGRGSRGARRPAPRRRQPGPARRGPAPAPARGPPSAGRRSRGSAPRRARSPTAGSPYLGLRDQPVEQCAATRSRATGREEGGGCPGRGRRRHCSRSSSTGDVRGTPGGGRRNIR